MPVTLILHIAVMHWMLLTDARLLAFCQFLCVFSHFTFSVCMTHEQLYYFVVLSKVVCYMFVLQYFAVFMFYTAC